MVPFCNKPKLDKKCLIVKTFLNLLRPYKKVRQVTLFPTTFVPLVVIRCHSMYHSSVLLSTILGKHLMIRRKHLYDDYKVMP